MQEKCEELETSASTAEAEHQNADASLEVRPAAINRRKEEVCEQIESLRVQLQVVAIAEQEFEGSFWTQSLEQEHERLSVRQTTSTQKYQDMKAPLEADIVITQEDVWKL